MAARRRAAELPPELVVRYQRAAELVADAPDGGVWLEQEEAAHVAAVIDELVELVRKGGDRG